MPTQLTNQASLTFRYGAETATVTSNIASTMLRGPLTAEKHTLEQTYRSGETLTYMFSLVNHANTALSSLIVSDDLGTYTIAGPVQVTPLTYTGPTQLYINGLFDAELTPVRSANAITFEIPLLPPFGNAMLLFQARVNQNALQNAGSALTNDAVITAAELTDAVYVSHTVPADDYADVHVVKSMTPNPVTEGERLTYDFTLYNYGNLEATEVVLTDTFSPQPDALEVTIDGSVLTSADYSYASGVLTLPGSGASTVVTIPPASFSQDAATGAITASPGIVVITVSGIV